MTQAMRTGMIKAKLSLRRTGVVLLVVLVAVAFLALAGYTFSNFMLAQYESSLLTGRQIQARALVDSGVEALRLLLMQPAQEQRDGGGLYNNPAVFQGMLVLDDPDSQRRGNVTVLAPATDDFGNYGGIRYGLEDESGRLNLNALLIADDTVENGGRDLLLGLPGMTNEIADAILDWIDEDDEIREYGAELESYTGLDPPYAPQNGPMNSVEELLLVRGVTPELLFGVDVNRNGMIDFSESSELVLGDPGDGSLSRGWSAYLTLYSMEANVNEDGLPRINVNQDDMETLYNELLERFDAVTATFIVAYRQEGPYTGSAPAELGVAGQPDFSKSARYPLTQILDLVDKKVRVSLEGADEAVVMESPWPNGPGMVIYLPLLMNNLTVNPSPFIPGRININEAPRAVLQGIPGMPEDLVDQIIAQRLQFDPNDDNENHRYETWLLADGILTTEEGELDIETMKALQPYICAGGDVHRAQVVGYFQDGNTAARIETVIDATTPLPRLLFWRDISHLGRGYAIESLGVELAE